jgi:hypothetical protein
MAENRKERKVRPLKKRELDPRIVIFAKEFIRTGKGKASALAAGYSPNSAASIGNQLRKHPYVVEELEKWKAKMNQEVNIDRQWFIKRLVRQIDFNPGELIEITEEGDLTLKPDAKKTALKYFDSISQSKSRSDGVAGLSLSRSLSFKNRDQLARMKFLAQLLGFVDGQGTNTNGQILVDGEVLEYLQGSSKPKDQTEPDPT